MNNTILVDERARDIGQFLVGRLLPFRRKRQVGPFTFIDHMGPAEIGPGKYMDVDQHPHIGLSTLTYLLEGEIEHRDSTGAVQIIKPGDVGFMTAGKAVTHTERTPKNLRDGQTRKMHGYQIWVAMPKELEESDPHFQYVPKNDIPECEHQGMRVRVAAGKAFGMESPLKVLSPLFMVDLFAPGQVDLDISNQVEGEIAVVVVEGTVHTNEEKIKAGQMLISMQENKCPLKIEAKSRVLLFGGTPLAEERHLYWNFVSHSKDRLEQAKKDWQDKKFPKVPGDNTYIPAP
ncbi:MAG: pirin family protein [Luteibaculum sp.]